MAFWDDWHKKYQAVIGDEQRHYSAKCFHFFKRHGEAL
jgi:hypothetical protein